MSSVIFFLLGGMYHLYSYMLCAGKISARWKVKQNKNSNSKVSHISFILELEIYLHTYTYTYTYTYVHYGNNDSTAMENFPSLSLFSAYTRRDVLMPFFGALVWTLGTLLNFVAGNKASVAMCFAQVTPLLFFLCLRLTVFLSFFFFSLSLPPLPPFSFVHQVSYAVAYAIGQAAPVAAAAWGVFWFKGKMKIHIVFAFQLTPVISFLVVRGY